MSHGFVRSWLLLSERYPTPGRMVQGHRPANFSLMKQTLCPRAGDPAEANAKRLAWKEHRSEGKYLDFEAIYGKPSNYQLTYAICYVHADADRNDVVLRVGSDDQSAVFINGKKCTGASKSARFGLTRMNCRSAFARAAISWSSRWPTREGLGMAATFPRERRASNQRPGIPTHTLKPSDRNR